MPATKRRRAQRPSSPQPPRRARRRRPASADEKNSLESLVVSLALKGALKKAAGDAIKSQVASGLSVVFKRGKQIVRMHPDGTVETLTTGSARKLAPATATNPVKPQAR